MTDEISMPLTNREFNKLVASTRMSLGMFSQLLTGADLSRRGYVVLYPQMPTVKYDLVFDNGRGLWRAQVKTLSEKTNQLALGTTTKDTDYFGYNAYQAPIPKKIPKYKPGDFDFLVGVDREQWKVYYIPETDLDFTKLNFTLTDERKEKYSNI